MRQSGMRRNSYVDARARIDAAFCRAATLMAEENRRRAIDLVSAGLQHRDPHAEPSGGAWIEAAGVLAAPSANASGEPSATTPRHANRGENAPFILAGGACAVGLESTVLT